MLLSVRAQTRVAGLVLAAASVGGALVTAAPADAMTLGASAVQEASRHAGQPYVYGAYGPTRFDCSGFTLYVYKRLGRTLPHRAALQYTAPGVRHIAQNMKWIGDLIFMRDAAGTNTHVGIYAGSNTWWVAPHTGANVKRQTLYSTNYVVGRLT